MISTDRAIELIRRQQAKNIEHLPFDDPQAYRWWNTTANVIREAFGAKHPNAFEFNSTSPSNFPEQLQRDHAQNIRQRKALLEGFIEQLELLRPTSPAGEVSVQPHIVQSDIVEPSKPRTLESALEDRPGDPGNQIKRRGRKSTFSKQQLEQARQMKAAGKTNHEIAKVLYGPHPTEAHRRSVPTMLKYHFGSKNRVEE